MNRVKGDQAKKGKLFVAKASVGEGTCRAAILPVTCIVSSLTDTGRWPCLYMYVED